MPTHRDFSDSVDGGAQWSSAAQAEDRKLPYSTSCGSAAAALSRGRCSKGKWAHFLRVLALAEERGDYADLLGVSIVLRRTSQKLQRQARWSYCSCWPLRSVATSRQAYLTCSCQLVQNG